MDGSNSTSGTRSNPLCETLEARSLFSATVGLDAKFGTGGTVTTDLGTSLQYGYRGVVLKDGRLLVAAEQSNGGGDGVALLAYNKDGSLSQSFGTGGKVTLTSADTAKLAGGVVSLMQASNGEILVNGEGGVLKLTLAGKDDTSYGVGGFAATRVPPQPYSTYNVVYTQLSDGSMREVYFDTQANRLYLTQVNAAGKRTTAIQRSIGTLGGFLAGVDANGVTVVSDTKVYRFKTTDLSKISSFGTGGVLDLTAAYDKWALANGPFYAYDPQHTKPIAEPQLEVLDGFDAKAGIGVAGNIAGVSPKVPSVYTDATPLNFGITPDGKSVTITANYPVGSILAHDVAIPADFESSTFGATFYRTDGTTATVDAFTDFPTSSNVTHTVVFAPDNSAYIIGSAAVKTDTGYKAELAVAKSTMV